jgi:hypothetical protein
MIMPAGEDESKEGESMFRGLAQVEVYDEVQAEGESQRGL